MKGCQIVQTNWKPAGEWECMQEAHLQNLMERAVIHFKDNYSYSLFKGTSSLDQLLAQAEIDVIGLNFSEGKLELYAIDVAFHEGGLNYGLTEESVMRVAKKIIRSAMCIYGYFGFYTGTIVFATPKINPVVYEKLVPCLKDVEEFLTSNGFAFTIRLFANEEFGEKVLQPVVTATAFTADTSELFMRSLQMYNLFAKNSTFEKRRTRTAPKPSEKINLDMIEVTDFEGLSEMKIGILVRSTLTKMLESEEIPQKEIERMQTEDYSKRTFDIQYPLLVKVSLTNGKKPHRYWAGTVKSYGEDISFARNGMKQRQIMIDRIF